MKEIEPEIVMSALCQQIERDGKRVQVDIYDDGEGGWLLEVVDEFGVSTMWHDAFPTEQAALAAAVEVVDQEGIDSLIGMFEPSEGPDLDLALNDAELDCLQRFLINGPLQETSMDVSILEGFLTAVAIGPRLVHVSEWLPWVWDMHQGLAGPEFETDDEANLFLSLLMRQYNTVLRAFAEDPLGFEPLFLRGREHGVRAWCEGFIIGTMFDEPAWKQLATAQPDCLQTLLALGIADNPISDDDVHELTEAVVPSLLLIHAHCLERRLSPAPVTQVRSGPKVGRNDPCPCGSGKKFKKCCGANAAPTTLH